MQAFADRAALCETMQTRCGWLYNDDTIHTLVTDRLATFYSRSRGGRWCKGETSGHFINVQRVFLDCDRDSVVYLGDPIGPACHTVWSMLCTQHVTVWLFFHCNSHHLVCRVHDHAGLRK